VLEYLNNQITGVIIDTCKDKVFDKSLLIKCFKKIYKDFEFNINYKEHIKIDEFLLNSSSLFEKDKGQKENGRYYTPKDLCLFMLEKMLDNEYEINKKILDPTCGNSQFLIEYMDLILSKNNFSDSDILQIVSNIFGNDINEKALLISKLRLFINSLKYLNIETSEEILKKIVLSINKNFTNFDFIDLQNDTKIKYDYIIGNPPYVEDSKYLGNIPNKYGNIYANVLENSTKFLKNSGVFSFVIPLSYVSTARMKKIRNYLFETMSHQEVYNFSDRPDSLFSSVHQKLTILIAKKRKTDSAILKSSKYNYWYKSERENLFKETEVTEVKKFDDFIPKLGSALESDIFYKILSRETSNCLETKLNYKENKDLKKLFLNMRLTFWVKCFLDKSRSKEYREFSIQENRLSYIYCLLNSSLFFWYWTVVSDCWHITSKELKLFEVLEISENQNSIYENLAVELQKKLEETKKYIGSKQIDYEYKHKECKEIIDKIDDNLAKVYALTKNELSYIKNFAIRYRKGEKD